MNSPAALYALRWLIRDTFRQAMAGKVFWLLLGLTGLCTLLCLGISIEDGEPLRPEGDYLYSRSGELLAGPNPEPGTLHLFFGAFKAPLHRDGAAAVHLIQVILGTWVAGAVGLLLTLVWTASFLPDFLQPHNASVLLAKPMPRWLLISGKFLGVVAFVAFQAAIFFLATWLALGIKTNVWLVGYLASCPLLIFQFAVLYSFSVALAVATRSTVACILGVVLFWALCLGINYARYAAAALPELQPGATNPPSAAASFLDLGYWILPKPADMIMILEDSLDTHSQMATLSALPEFAAARQLGYFHPSLILFTSLCFGLALLALSGQQLGKIDY